jgi:hypothetical protein
MDRRTYLAITTSVFVAGCTTSEKDSPPEDDVVDPPDVTVTTEEPTPIDSVDQLIEALASASVGDVVTVPPDVELDLTGLWEITVPRGVTLAGGRDNGDPGAVLRSPDGDRTPESDSFKRKLVLEEGARLTGFRLKGHFHEYVNAEEAHDGDYYAHRGGGGVTAKRDAVVDNNEISGWPYAAVFTRGNAHIHHNYIHHNTWEGLGYGVAIPEGNHQPLIESNYFNYNRHSISGAGGSDVGYVARFNVVGEQWVGSQFDMHGTEGMTGIAGDRIVINRNTFKATTAVEAKSRNPGGEYYAIDIRGTPTEGAWIERNWFYHEDRESAVRQPDRYENVHFENNHYGPDDSTNTKIGAPTTRVDGHPFDVT